ncbi:MAG: hypothetical protein Q8O52_23795 [Sulfuritalea sp.]|nr:hypothetical protein [Sulfuritalea sp.]
MSVDSATAPGRVCPTRYRYGAAAIAGAPERSAQTLYAIGGLYGNLPALDAIEAMARAEPGPVALCFNGDFNWFNIDDAGFRAINRRVAQHAFIVGNVEAELGADADDAGCGCAYPESVDDAVVARSNLIHAALKRTAARHRDLLAGLQESASPLPRSLSQREREAVCLLSPSGREVGREGLAQRWRVGDLRIGVVHGDADSLAGWRFDAARLDDPAESEWRAAAFAAAGVDMFASSHTCLPAMRCFDYQGEKLVANNGAAGMPNFAGTEFGILTRIGLQASPHAPLYGHALRDVHVDALAVRYDPAAWQKMFLANWPAGSAAWLSYFRRIADGPDYQPRQAFPTTMETCRKP